MIVNLENLRESIARLIEFIKTEKDQIINKD